MQIKVRVWDAPTRIFHWLLALSIPAMWWTATTGGSWLTWHKRLGLLVCALIIFRILWGFGGSQTARFSNFLQGKNGLQRYLKGNMPEHEQPGHNPVGALSVLVLLGMVIAQLVTGLFAPDNNTWLNPGYLNHLVSEATASTMYRIHLTLFWVLVGMIALHIVAVFAYLIIKKHNLIRPMITGFKTLTQPVNPPLKFAGWGTFLACAAVSAALVYLIANA